MSVRAWMAMEIYVPHFLLSGNGMEIHFLLESVVDLIYNSPFT